MLHRVYGERYILANPPDIPGRVRENTKVIAGHITFWPKNLEPIVALNRDVATMTILRDPIQRVISDYYWIKHYDFDYIVHYRKEPLEKWLEKGFSRGINVMTAWYSGIPDPQKADVEKAKDTIRNSITFFGLLSKFDEFTDICSNILDWNIDIQEPRAKVNPHKPDYIPEKTIEVVKEYNRKDIELYEWAQEHYEKRKEEWLS